MIAGGNHTFIPNQPPVSCDYDPALAGGRLPPLPSQILYPPTAPPPFPRVCTVPRPPCAKEAVSEADWRIVLLKSRHFPVFQIAPCRGAVLSCSARKYPKNRPGEALQMWSIHHWQKSKRITPTPKRPPLGTPPAAARQLNAQRSGFIVGECCRAQRIFHLNDCRWQSYLDS